MVRELVKSAGPAICSAVRSAVQVATGQRYSGGGAADDAVRESAENDSGGDMCSVPDESWQVDGEFDFGPGFRILGIRRAFYHVADALLEAEMGLPLVDFRATVRGWG